MFMSGVSALIMIIIIIIITSLVSYVDVGLV